MGATSLNIGMIFALLLGAASLLLGVWLLWRWRRAIRVGQHPTCRACGFDLRGLQVQATGTQDISPCPECGTPLTPDNIATGDRRRSPFTLIVATTCLLIAMGIFGLTIRNIWPTLTSRLPTPVLVWQSALDLNDSIGTITELANRIGTNRMSTAQANTLIERALDQQKNAAVWFPVWGSIVENAHAAGQTSEDQWKRYLEVAATPFVDVSDHVAQGDPFTINVGVKECRVSDRGQLPLVDMSLTGSIHGVEVVPYKLSFSGFGLSRNGAAWSSRTADTAKLEPGEHTLTIKVITGTRDAQDESGKPTRFTWEHTITRPITVSPRGTATHNLKTDPALAPQLQKCISIERVHLLDGHMIGGVRADLMLYFQGLPIGLGMDIFLQARQSDGSFIERSIGSVACKPLPLGVKHGFSSGSEIHNPMPLIDALIMTGSKANLILRPNLDIAKTRPNLYDIWGEEIVIPNQQVKINLRERPEAGESNLNNQTAPAR